MKIVIRQIDWKKGGNLMQARRNLRQGVLILAMVLGTSAIAGTVRAAAFPVPQASQDQDYSKNKRYQQGMSEGRDDRAHNLDHSKKRHFKKDDDQKAYEAGYQVGRQGDEQK
jgi:hypothetical protein